MHNGRFSGLNPTAVGFVGVLKMYSNPRLNTKKGCVFLIRLDVSRCKILDEFTEEQQNEYFSVSGNKVIHNVDTLYYTITLDETLPVTELISFLANKKAEALDSKNKEIIVGEFVLKPFGFSIYEYRLGIENYFDFFVSSYLPNDKTPRIIVQLRSIGLWLDGEQTLIKDSYAKICNFLSQFSIVPLKVDINRIDYAFHTNIIQSTNKFFNDDLLINSLKTPMKMGQKVFRFGRELLVDYLSIGNQKSNNIFFRAYNKTKEVIEMNYKGFFIEHWYNNKLISSFDKWCLEFAYQKGTYNSLIIARVNWYLEFGNDAEFKELLNGKLMTCNINSDNFEHIENCIRGIIPEVTTIVNVEFQTKRKFYATMHPLFMKSLPCSLKPDNKLHDLFQIIENKKPFIDYLTEKSVAFYKNKTDEKLEFTSWWQRIRSCKIKSLSKDEVVRDFARKLDIKKLEKRVVSTFASMSAYRNIENKKTFVEDMSDFICTLNDNDLQELYYVDKQTGEFLDFDSPGYEDIKKKQMRRIKPFFKEKVIDAKTEKIKERIIENNFKSTGLLLVDSLFDIQTTGVCLCDDCYFCYKGEACAYPENVGDTCINGNKYVKWG